MWSSYDIPCNLHKFRLITILGGCLSCMEHVSGRYSAVLERQTSRNLNAGGLLVIREQRGLASVRIELIITGNPLICPPVIWCFRNMPKTPSLSLVVRKGASNGTLKGHIFSCKNDTTLLFSHRPGGDGLFRRRGVILSGAASNVASAIFVFLLEHYLGRDFSFDCWLI
jgi:hypothetical protein